MNMIDKFLLGWRFLKSRRTTCPLSAVIVTNRTCNGRCPHCFLGREKRDEIMPFSRYCTVVDELKVLGCSHLNLHGGESLLREDIGAMIDYAKNRGFYLQIVTNGLLVRKRLAELLKVDKITVSLDGSEQFNDIKKNYDGYYKEAVLGIKALRFHNRNVSLNTILYEDSLNEIAFVCSFAKEHGLSVQFLMSMHSTIKAVPSKDDFSIDKLIIMIERILTLKEYGYPVLSSRHGLDTILWICRQHKRLGRDLAYVVLDGMTRNIKCCAGRNYLVIDYDGYVYPCFYHQSRIANAFEMGVLNSMKEVQRHLKCGFCLNPANIDQNAIYGLNLSVISEYLRSFF